MPRKEFQCSETGSRRAQFQCSRSSRPRLTSWNAPEPWPISASAGPTRPPRCLAEVVRAHRQISPRRVRCTSGCPACRCCRGKCLRRSVALHKRSSRAHEPVHFAKDPDDLRVADRLWSWPAQRKPAVRAGASGAACFSALGALIYARIMKPNHWRRPKARRPLAVARSSGLWKRNAAN